MRKTLSVKYLKSIHACSGAVEEFAAQPERNTEKILLLMIKQEKLDWINWLICRLFPTKKMKVQYAIFAARQVLDIYEAKYPDDQRPRLAIEAAEAYLKAPTKRNKSAADSAGYSADRAADSAYSAYRSGYSAYGAADSAYSAYSAADSAYRAAYSAYSAYRAADSAYSAYRAADNVYSAYRAADSVGYKKMQLKIIQYGLKLLGVKQ